MAESIERKHGDRMKSALTNGKFSDCTVLCGSRSWKCHKVVLCSQSDYFSAAFEGAFKESQKNEITIQEESPIAINLLIHFLYNGNYKSIENQHFKGPREVEIPALLEFHTMMYTLGDRLLVQGLKEEAGFAVDDTMQTIKT